MTEQAEAVEVNEAPEVTLSLVGVEDDPDEDIIKDTVDAIAEAVTDVIYDTAESPATVTFAGAAHLPRIGPPADGASSAQLARIVQQRGRVAEAAAALARAAQEKKYAQAEYDTAVASLLSKIDQPNLPGMDLEDVAKQAEEQVSETLTPVISDAWRSVTLDELGITGREAKALTAADILTLGAIADWTRTRSGTGFEDGLGGIKGLGEAGQEKVQAQLDAYWASHPVDAPVATVADDDSAADDLDEYDTEHAENLPGCDDDETGTRDALFEQAVDVIFDAKRCSVSLLQRRLTVGYTRSRQLIDGMVELGIVDSDNHDIVWTKEQWESHKAKVSQ